MKTPTHARARQIVEGRPPGQVRDELLAYIDDAEQNERLAAVVKQYQHEILRAIEAAENHRDEYGAIWQALADALKGGT